MKNLILLSLLLITSFAKAQLNTMQDAPELDWAQIESENSKIVYPNHLEEKAQYILNLLDFYGPKVAAPYDFQTSKYTIIIRSQQASPNGFVTLAPKRSEWFSASSFTPVINTLEWYQALAVHEYRHMVQFDVIKDTNVKWGWYVFGEPGQAVLMAITAPNWYFEGDAVYSETVLTNSGRGRLPRFSERLKSLVINDEIPSYDQFRGGVYNTRIPNHYVYGYFLVTNAYTKYGAKTWKKIIQEAGRKPYNPYTFYNAFERITGQTFEDFYNETFATLKTQWGVKYQEHNELFTTYHYPIESDGSLYYLKNDLDSFYELRADGKKVSDIKLVNPKLSKIDIKRGNLVFARQMPSPRYAYKDFSDIFLMDINSKEERRITNGARAYSPQINPEKDEILTIEFKDAKRYGLALYNFAGQKLKEILIDGFDIAEAAWISADEAIVSLLDKEGMKYIASLNVREHKHRILKKAGRNSAFAMRVKGEKVYFSGDDKGVTNIFELDAKTKALARCSNEDIGAFNPFPGSEALHYVASIGNGQKVKTIPYQCEAIPSDYIGDLEQYLGTGPSDNFTKAKPVMEENYAKRFYKKNWVSSDYPELERGLTPHSWSFIGGQGFQLQAAANNYLNTFGINAAIGENALESRPFAELSLVYAKYYPLLSMNLSYRERKDQSIEWSEAGAQTAIALPYSYRRAFFSGINLVGFSAQHLEVSGRDQVANAYEISDDQIFISGIQFQSSYLKDMRFRELQPSWGYSFNGQYKNAKSREEDSFDSYLGYGALNLYTPGLDTNQGFKLNLVGEYRPKNLSAYRIISPADQVGGFAFSRGYEFSYVERWSKAAFNYILPLGYENYTYGRWYYISRIYANLFFDHTKIEDFKDQSLNSVGAEFFLESLLLRKLPITIGIRHANKLSDNESYTDFFLNVNVNY